MQYIDDKIVYIQFNALNVLQKIIKIIIINEFKNKFFLLRIKKLY